MQKQIERKWLVILGLVVGLLPPVAFAEEAKASASDGKVTSSSQRPDSEVLKERAAEYWRYRVARTEQVYDFYAPPELGGPSGWRDTSELGNVGYKWYEIDGVEIDGDTAVVKLTVQTELMLNRPTRIPEERLRFEIEETWNKIEGTWYKKPIPRDALFRLQKRPES